MPSGEHNRKLSDLDRDEIVRLYTTRLPDGTWLGVTTIARRFGVSNNAIQTFLKTRGVKTRTAKEAHAHGKRCKPIKNLPVGAPPVCECGCGGSVPWNRRENQWRPYIVGHYRPRKPYHNRDWLIREYCEKRKSAADIARAFGVCEGSVVKAMCKHGIPRRSASESHKGLQVGPLNPAWKGGVAEWEYSSDWKALARSIRQRDLYTCQHCGECRKRWGRSLHVHHQDGNKLNNVRTNLISLCALCHHGVFHGSSSTPSTV